MHNKQTRLNKYIAECTEYSRRAADELIASGKVKVNSKIVTEMGFSVGFKDIVLVNGKTLKPKEKTYIAYNKPPGYITTRSDEKGRKTIYDIVPEEIKELKPAGRLDKDSTGLIILTNDGELIQSLTHPKVKIPKIYRVSVEGNVSNNDMYRLSKGIEIEKGKKAYAEVVIIEFVNGTTTLEITLYQGYNRQIRKMMDAIGHKVISLKRTSHGCITLGSLKKGSYRYLKPKEIVILKNYLKKRENP